MNKKGLPYKDFSDICGEVFLQEVLKDTSSIGYFKTKIDQKETWIKICDAFGLDAKYWEQGKKKFKNIFYSTRKKYERGFRTADRNIHLDALLPYIKSCMMEDGNFYQLKSNLKRKNELGDLAFNDANPSRTKRRKQLLPKTEHVIDGAGSSAMTNDPNIQNSSGLIKEEADLYEAKVFEALKTEEVLKVEVEEAQEIFFEMI